MLDLIVVGGGYWGVATAVFAQRRGLQVAHFDNSAPDSASRAASAHFAFGWYKGQWAARVRRAYEQAEFAGVHFDWCGAFVNSPRDRKLGKLRGGITRPDWAIFEPSEYLALHPALQAGVDLVVNDGSPGVALTNGERVYAKGVVVAAGVWTDQLLQRTSLPVLGVAPLRGTGVVMCAEPPEPGRVYVHALNPFKQTAIRPWGAGHIRVGETSEVKHGFDYVSKMLGQVEHLGLPVKYERISGLRPMLSEPTVKQVARGVVAATGGGRIGAVLGFWAAEESCRQLGL